MSAYFDRVYFNATSSGTGDFVVASAVTGYLTPAGASIPNSTIVTYIAESADRTQWEEGLGTYVSGTTTLQRTTVRRSTNSGSAVNFSAAPRVFLDVHQEEARIFERIAVNSSGNIIIGSPTADATFSNGGSTPYFQIKGVATDEASIAFTRYRAFTAGPILLFGHSRSDTLGTQTVLQSGDEIGVIEFQGSDGTNFRSSAQIAAFVDGTPGAGDMPGRLAFSTSADGAASVTERMRIDSTGLVTIPGGSDALPALAVGPTPSSVTAFQGFPVMFGLSSNTNNTYTQRFNVFGNHAFGNYYIFTKTRNATPTSQTIVQSGDDVLLMRGYGSDGVNDIPMCELVWSIDGTPDVDEMPGRMEFWTTEQGSASLVQRLVLGSDSRVELGIGAFILTPEISTPSNPAANYLKVYAKDSSGITKLAILDSAGTETLLGAGGGGGSPGGSDTFVQFNDGGSSFGGDSGLVYDKTNNKLTIGGDTAATNAVTNVLKLISSSSGTPANGIGVGIQFEVETTASNNEIGAAIEAVTTDVTSTSEDFDLVFKLMANGATATESVRVKSSGQLQINTGPLFTHPGGGQLGILDGFGGIFMIGNPGYIAPSDRGFVWSSTTDPTSGAVDLAFTRLAAGSARLEGITALTNTINPALRLRHNTTGTPAAGIGVGIELEQETASGNFEVGAVINAVTTDVTSTSEDFDLVFCLMAAGAAAAEVLRFTSDKSIRINTGRPQLYLKNDGNDPLITNDPTNGLHMRLRQDGNTGSWLSLEAASGMISLWNNIAGATGGQFDVNGGTPNAASLLFDHTGTRRVGVGLIQHSADVYYMGPGRPTIDEAKFDTWLTGAAAKTSATTNLVGGNIRIHPGDGASGASGNAHGGHLYLYGGKAYGTGTHGRVNVWNETAITNTVLRNLRLTHETTGTPANGIGVGIDFEVETTSANFEVGVSLEAVVTDVTSTSEDFDYVVKTMAAGATAAERLRISENGITPSTREINKVQTLTDGATPALDAKLGNVFKLVAAGNRTIAVPSNKPASGETQRIIIMHEASGADRTLALTTGSSGAFRFGTDITALTATTNGLVDYIGCVFNQADDRWDVVSYSKGF